MDSQRYEELLFIIRQLDYEGIHKVARQLERSAGPIRTLLEDFLYRRGRSRPGEAEEDHAEWMLLTARLANEVWKQEAKTGRRFAIPEPPPVEDGSPPPA